MKIGFIAVNDKPTNELATGGTEVFVTMLAKEMIKRGHEVYIYASGDSYVEGATMIKASNTSLVTIQEKLEKYIGSSISYIDREFISNMLCLRNVVCAKKMEDIIDIYHDNTGSPIIGTTLDLLGKPVVSTLHMPITNMYKFDEVSKYIMHENTHYVTISQFQNNQLPYKSSLIYNGIDISSYLNSTIEHSEEMIWIGRIDENTPKGLDDAIIVANNLGHQLRFVGFAESEEYFNNLIKPLLTELITHQEQFKSIDKKVAFYKKAKVSLIPIKWEEPFGLTFIESMAAGTPVITYAKGAAPEIIEDGKTGFLVNASNDDIRGDWLIKETGLKGLQEAINRLYDLTDAEYQEMRMNCENRVKNNFTVKHMADKYEMLYRDLVNNQMGYTHEI